MRVFAEMGYGSDGQSKANGKETRRLWECGGDFGSWETTLNRNVRANPGDRVRRRISFRATNLIGSFQDDVKFIFNSVVECGLKFSA